jgi:hypothetical protein
MTTELRIRSNQSQNQFVRAYSEAWRNQQHLHDPSTWLLREPEIEEKMLKDADIGQALTYRKHLIAGRKWALTPRCETDALCDLAVEVGTTLLEGIDNFTGARMLLSRAFFSGSRFARIHHEPRVLTIGDGVARTWLVPTRLEDLDKRMYRIVPTNDGETISAHWERWNTARGEWKSESMQDGVQTIRHIYQDDQASLGHGRGLREALGWWWYTKMHVMQESVQAVEKYAQGILTAKIDGLAAASADLDNTQVRDEWIDTLEDMRARNIIVYDSRDEIAVINGNAEGWQLLDRMEEKLKNTITTLILGSPLPTTASGGGSFALAKVQENSTEALVNFDRELLEGRGLNDPRRRQAWDVLGRTGGRNRGGVLRSDQSSRVAGTCPRPRVRHPESPGPGRLVVA